MGTFPGASLRDSGGASPGVRRRDSSSDRSDVSAVSCRFPKRHLHGIAGPPAGLWRLRKGSAIAKNVHYRANSARDGLATAPK